eukprot:GHUV01007928.1.p3 GENE.GHUV01007928.1~~GHUV01007928.1.p3  ORF type:complete len:113 (+),score=44.55 GHUV01007928.1:1486-1824(+)
MGGDNSSRVDLLRGQQQNSAAGGYQTGSQGQQADGVWSLPLHPVQAACSTAVTWCLEGRLVTAAGRRRCCCWRGMEQWLHGQLEGFVLGALLPVGCRQFGSDLAAWGSGLRL